MRVSVQRAVVRRYESGIIGVPANGQFIPVTNSEMGGLTCRRRWWFSSVEGLRRPMQGGAVDLGSSWDEIVEDVYRWWMETDTPYPSDGLTVCAWCDGSGDSGSGDPWCPRCDGTGEGPLERVMVPWHRALEDDPPPFTEADVARERERFVRAFNGYVHHYEARPLQNMRIVGVKSKIARVVLNPATGKPYRPDTLIVRTDTGWVRAGSFAEVQANIAGTQVHRVNWPVYQIGELDAVARDRASGAGWVIDAKFTGAMESYRGRLQVDPQLPGYCWLLDANREEFGITEVRGMMYDLTHSRLHSDPFQLQWKPPLVRDMRDMAEQRGVEIPKGAKAEDLMVLLGITEGHGGFSVSPSKLAGVPSWIMRAAVERAGLNPDEYAEAVEWCEQNVDGGLYDRPWRTFSREDLERYQREVYAKAAQVTAGHRRAAALGRREDLDIEYPRTPICALPGGSCPYKGPCAMDTPEARSDFDQHEPVVWRGEHDADDNTQNLQWEIDF